VAQAGLADAVDAFMEGIAFSGEQIARVFEAARALGLPIKLHADQLSNLGGAALAAKFSALSADHLEHTDEAGAAAMAKAGTVAAGKWCDLAICDVERLAELVYRIGFNPLHRRVWRGQ